jgi:methylamine dehydrogenase accessory protein MauD
VKGVVISESLLWVIQIATVLVVVSLARQVGLLHLRLPIRGPGPVEEAPQLGATVDVPPKVATLRSREADLLQPNHLALVVFVNSGCSICTPILQGLKPLMRVDPQLAVTLAVDGEPMDGLQYLGRYGFSDGVSSELLGTIDAGGRPFAIVLDSAGTVLASGVPNTLEQLEVLLADARHTQAVPTKTSTGIETLAIVGSTTIGKEDERRTAGPTDLGDRDGHA